MNSSASQMKGTRPGAFIVLEGIDGSGTTTQVELLGTQLRMLGHEVVTTREPTGGPVGVLLRQALTGSLREGTDLVTLDWASMALLFAADRADHVSRVIAPALARGAIVVSDRYDLSSLIYQSLTSPEGERARPWLRSLNAQATRPDLTLVLDVPEQVARERREARSDQQELFEKTELQRKLAVAYRDAAALMKPDRLHCFSGEGTKEEVARRICASLGSVPELAWMGLPDS